MPHTIHQAIFRSQPEEHTCASLAVEGEIPRELSGTFLRNGPGLLEVGSDTLNFFDGHALIAGLSFSEGKARFRSRLVKTPLLAAETHAKAMKKRRIFTNLPKRWANLFDVDFGNNAMHDVYAWGGKVIAGNDPGHFALDSRTLETSGAEFWGGAVGKGEEMSPMPYRDPVSGHLIAWIKTKGGIKPDRLRFVELDASMKLMRQTSPVVLSASPVLVHDHRATASWYVATEQALRLSVGSALWGKRTLYQSLVAPPGGTAALLLVPRNGEARLVRIPLPEGIEIAFHVINAYEEGENVIVDLVTYAGRICFEGAASEAHQRANGIKRYSSPSPTPIRFVVDPKRGVIVGHHTLGNLPLEAPEIADDRMGAKYGYVYGPTLVKGADVPDTGGYFFYPALAKVKVETGESETWSAGSEAVVSPPAFVRRANSQEEDDGWLIAWVMQEDGTSVVVLDAKAIARGPVAKVKLGVRLPGVSHTRWAADLQLD